MNRAGRAAALGLGLSLAVAACAGPTNTVSERAAPSLLRADAGAASAWISAYRQAHGLSAVTDDAVLDRLAQAQADAMAAQNRLSHTVAGALPDRLARIGRSESAAAENVSAGYGDLEAALGGWRRSPEHDRNLLYPPVRHIGIAAAMAPGTRYRTFWALVMTD